MPKAMIVTVGVGETVSHGICFSIRQQNPDYIIFVVTKESAEKILPLIRQDRIVKDKTHVEFVLSDENDVEEIRFESQKMIDSFIKKGYEPKDIVIDYTSGTKAMSAGVVLATLDKKLGSLVYVSGKRDKNGRVISGSERVIGIEPNRVYAESLFVEGVKLFNSYQFDVCLEIVCQAKVLFADMEFQAKIDLLEKLTQAYSLWEKFNLTEAFSQLDNLTHNNELFSMWGIKNRIEKNKAILYQEKNNYFCAERAVDLLENARRRGDYEKKFDDAIARLYRILEYLSQYKIAQRNLYHKDEKGDFDTESLDVDKLPPELKGKYLTRRDPKDNKVRLSGLNSDYELLFELDDELGRLFKKENSIVKKLLFQRNNSVLAHGFEPISEDTYKEMIAIVEKFVKHVFPKMDDLIEKIKFPQLKIK